MKLAMKPFASWEVTPKVLPSFSGPETVNAMAVIQNSPLCAGELVCRAKAIPSYSHWSLFTFQALGIIYQPVKQAYFREDSRTTWVR